MTEPTPDAIRAIARAVCARFDCEIVDKRTDDGMRALSHVLAPSIPPADFVSRYATAIGRRIFLPFTPGEFSDQWPAWSQGRIIVHEAEHVEQFRLDPLFPARYLLATPWRAIYEAQALAAGWQFDRWRGAKHLPPDQQALSLHSYALDAEAKAAAVAVLESSLASLSDGVLVSEVASFVTVALPHV